MLFQEGKVEERSGGVRMHVLSSGMRGMNANLPGTLVMEDTRSAEVQTRVVSRTGIAQEGGRTHGKWGRPGPQGGLFTHPLSLQRDQLSLSHSRAMLVHPVL